MHLCPPSLVFDQIRAFSTSKMEAGTDRAVQNAHAHSDPTLRREEIKESLNHGDSWGEWTGREEPVSAIYFSEYSNSQSKGMDHRSIIMMATTKSLWKDVAVLKTQWKKETSLSTELHSPTRIIFLTLSSPQPRESTSIISTWPWLQKLPLCCQQWDHTSYFVAHPERGSTSFYLYCSETLQLTCVAKFFPKCLPLRRKTFQIGAVRDGHEEHCLQWCEKWSLFTYRLWKVTLKISSAVQYI